MKRISFFIAVLAVVFTSCRRNQVSLVQHNFGEEVEQQQNLVFTFDKDLVPDSLQNVWDSTEYVRFEPKVDGKFRWNNARELVFSPSTGFAPSTDYKATITDAVLKLNGQYGSVGEPKSMGFHSPYLKMTGANGYWVVSDLQPGRAALSIALDFNYPVDPTAVSSLLKLKLGEREVSYQLRTQAPSAGLELLVDGIERSSMSDLSLSLLLQKGLPIHQGTFKTKEDQQLSIAIPNPDELEITQALPETEGMESRIRVFTTQAVDPESISQSVSVEPQVPFTASVTPGGFLLNGEFQSGTAYTLTVSTELRGMLGGSLKEEYKSTVTMGEIEPAIAFMSQKGVYLSSAGSRNIGVRISSIPKVQVTVWKVYENNILHYLRSSRYSDYWYDEDGEYASTGSFVYNTYEIGSYADKVYDRQVETRDLARKGSLNLLNLSFDDLGVHKGIYLVSIASTDDRWINATKLVALSDVGMIVKHSDNELVVFTNSIRTADPVHGAQVTLMSSNNQVVGTTRTDRDGIARFSNLRNLLGTFVPAMVTVRHDGDFNYLYFNDARVNTARYDVGGRRSNSTGQFAFLYGDRDLYRPGETVHLNTIVRDEAWKPVTDVPVKVRLVQPNGKEFRMVRGQLSKQGSYSTDIPVPEAAMTGRYHAEIYTANDVLIAGSDIQIEEFMPDRIDVKVQLSKPSILSNEGLDVGISAVNFFGPPAANRRYEVEFSVVRKVFRPKGLDGYDFTVKTENGAALLSNDLHEGTTDENGKATVAFPAHPEWKDEGLLQGNAYVTVTDENGRPVNRTETFPIHTQEVYFGAKLTEYYVNRGERFRIPVVAVNTEGKAVGASARIQVVRFDWYSAIEREEYGSRYRYISHKKERMVFDQTVNIPAAGFDFAYTPAESGEYEIRVSGPDAEHGFSKNFYAFGWGYTTNTSFEVNTEGQVDMQADKDEYQVGDKAKILFKTPFNGKLLVTIETDGLLEHRYLTTDKKGAVLEIPIKQDLLPNFYVSATLFRPLDDGTIPLTVAHGYLPVKVSQASTRLPVSIVAAATSRSKLKQTITVRSAPKQDIEVTVAVVDEGILSVSGYETPDPHGFFYQKKALGVNAYDVYPFLLPDLALRRSSVGGDAEYSKRMGKRNNPLANKRVKLVAAWSGILKTDGRGEAKYTLDIPQFSGDLRVMACAYKDNAFGSAEHHMKIADPVVISTGLPRFLSPRDTVQMPVTLTNTTKQAQRVTVNLSKSGPLAFAGSTSKEVSLPAIGEGRILVPLYASASVGAGSVTIAVSMQGETFTDVTDITVRPPATFERRSGSGEVKTRAQFSLSNDFVPGSAEATLLVSRNPMVQFTKPLNYLIGYPYGCVEQTTSQAFPQIYYADLIKNMKFKGTRGQNPAFNVQEAIRKLQSMQLYNGALAYWPGGDNESWWGTVYAMHFLCEARKAGYDVNGEVIRRGLAYIAMKTKSHTIEKDYAYDNGSGQTLVRNIYAKENFYGLFVLAAFGKADLASMNYFKSNISMLALDSRYLLAASYLAVGDRTNYQSLLPTAFAGEASKRVLSGSFYSYLRDQALAASVLLDVDPDNPQIPIILRHLSQQVNSEPWLNTQEAAFAFMALGKYMRRLPAVAPTATIRLNGKEVGNFTGDDLSLSKGLAGGTVDIEVKGQGPVFYFWQLDGLPASARNKESDQFLQVRRRVLNRAGQPVNLNAIRQGELLVIDLSLTSIERSSVENVVVTDLLPAGFEIENPRLTEAREMPWIKDASTPEYFDVRDDRIHFFTTATNTTKHFYYVVRAVSPGTYIQGSVGADAMYDGSYHSYSGSGTVRILAP